jgi:UDP-2,4-diacetamido-2,4,6-trideoxy-beta-L-altropyranose hydrolase
MTARSLRFFFRVSRSPEIGTGHWARCQVLASALRASGAQVHSNEHANSSAAFLTEIQALGAQPDDWVVFDSYALGEVWERDARQAQLRVLTIDDAPKRQYAADVLLDPNVSALGARRWTGYVAPHTQVFAGADYLLLREEFIQAGARATISRPPEAPIRNVLVSMGGSDPPGVALRVVEAVRMIIASPHAFDLKADLRNLCVTVLGGALNTRASQLESLVGQLPNAQYLSATENIAALMASADLCVGAGGVTIWERAYMGLPSLVVTLAENQREAVHFFDQEGAHKSLGWHEDVSAATIARAIAAAIASPVDLRAMAARAKTLVGEPRFVRDPLQLLLSSQPIER